MVYLLNINLFGIALGASYYDLLLGISLIICLSLTVGGILVLFRIEHSKRIIAHQYLQYSLIFLYVFGYYSLWSQILLPLVMDRTDLLDFNPLISQLGAPFFNLALLMLLLWCANILQLKNRVVIPITLALCIVFSIAFVLWGWTVEDSVRAVNSLIGFLVLAIIFGCIALGKNHSLPAESRKLILALSACAGLLHLTYFTSLVDQQGYEAAFALGYFLFNTSLAIEFIHATNRESKKTLVEFIATFGISKREADVMQEIYAGKTNQEIANSLFISLQTVKDHSSRIYQKVRVKNRNQLSALLRDSS